MKDFEDDDPMELEAVAIPDGDPEEHARSIMEEFLSMGMSKENVMDLFRNPFYVGTHRLYRKLGEERIARLIQAAPASVLGATVAHPSIPIPQRGMGIDTRARRARGGGSIPARRGGGGDASPYK